MQKNIETAMAVLFTASRLWCTSTYFLVKQASFRNQNDITSAQSDVAFEIGTGLIGFVIKHEDGFVPAGPATPYLNAVLCGERAYTARQSDCLHQRRRLSDHIRSWSDNFSRD